MENLQDHGIGALAFGVELPSSKQSFPTGPTWILYAAHEGHCLEDVPLLLRRDVFCSAYTAQARVFRTYSSWVLALLLRKVCSCYNVDMPNKIFPCPLVIALGLIHIPASYAIGVMPTT